MSKDIQQQKKYKILVVGDLCVDEYIYGTIDRLSPEAPVPVFVEKERKTVPGMSGNVLRNLKNLLPDSLFSTHQNGEDLIRKTRFIESRSNYQIMRHDIEKDIEPIMEKEFFYDNFDCVVISDYDKGFLTEKFINSITKSLKCQIFSDTKKSDLSSFHNCFIKINEKERQKIHSLPESSQLITTLGPNGAEFLGKNYKVDPVVVHDVCGAGDVFLAALVARWLETGDMDSSIHTANRCAAYSVTKQGTYAISREEYEKLCI